MTRLTQLHDLLTEHGGTLSYAALAGMLDLSQKAVATVVAQAARLNIARNIAPMGHGQGGMAQLCPNAVAPTSSRVTYEKARDRQDVALALLLAHPEGLTQANIATLTEWGHATVTKCMLALEETGTADVTGGTAGRPKTYTLPQVATVAPRQALPLPRTQARVKVDLTGELGAARKLVAGLRVKSARGLACAGNYKLSRAEELFAQLKAMGHA